MLNNFKWMKFRDYFLVFSFACAFIFGICGYIYADESAGADEDDLQSMEVSKNMAEGRAKSPAITILKNRKEMMPHPVLPEGKIMIRQILVSGSTLLADQAIDNIKTDFENQELTAKQMQRCVDLINRAYSREGYISSYAYVIPDKISEGVLEIRVVEGRTGKIEIKGNKFYSEEFIRSRISLKEGQPFNFRQLNRDLFKINKHPDRKVSVVLDSDKESNSTNITLTVKDRTPWHTVAQWDNYGAEAILYNRYKLFLTHNNVSGHDDSLTAKVEWAEGDAHKIYDLDYNLPLNDKWKFEFYILPYKSEDYYYKDNKDTDFEKRARKFYFWFYQSLISEPNIDLVSSYGFTYFDIFWYKPYDEYMERTKQDCFRILKWDLSLNRVDKYGRWVITNDLQKALPNLWAGVKVKADMCSVPGAKGNYVKDLLTVARRQKITSDIDFVGKFRWQLSSATLTGVNAFSAGGYCGVIDNRGFPRTQAPADSGQAVNLGFTFPAYFVPKNINVPYSKTKLYDDLKLFTFWDDARAVLKSPKLASNPSDPNDKKVVNLRSVGFGVTFTVPDQNLSIRVDCGFPLSAQTPKDGDHTHTWISVTKGF